MASYTTKGSTRMAKRRKSKDKNKNKAINKKQ